MEMRYFSSVKGRAFQRRGTTSYIGCRLIKGKGFEWNEDAVVAIPESDVLKNLKDFDNAVRRGSLKKRSVEDHTAWIAMQKTAATEAAQQPVQLAPQED